MRKLVKESLPTTTYPSLRSQGGKTVTNTVWVDVGDCMSKETLGILKHCLVGRWKDLPNSFPLASDVEAWENTMWRLKSNLMAYQLGKDLPFMVCKSK